jgi:malonyl-CoA O-methyltransferase
MAASLVDLLPADLAPQAILELGCGTGHLTRRLAARFPGAALTATDLSEAMLREAALHWPADLARPRWERLDARVPERRGERFGLVASNAMVQWFPDLEAHLRAVRGLVSTNSVYLVSGFSRGHFPELERILGSDEFAYPPGPGHELSEAAEAARRAGWNPAEAREEAREEVHPTAQDFLRHLKASGANRPPPDGRPLTRAKLRRLLERLESEAAAPGGVAVTWKPWFLRLEAAPAD